MAELLGHQFKSVFTVDDDHLSSMSHHIHPCIEDIIMGIIWVEKRLNSINIHKVSGPDKILNIILKTCSEKIYVHWLTFINKVLMLVICLITGEMETYAPFKSQQTYRQ